MLTCQMRLHRTPGTRYEPNTIVVPSLLAYEAGQRSRAPSLYDKYALEDTNVHYVLPL